MVVMGHVLRSKLPDLVSTLFAMAVLLVVSSSLVYYAERDVQPEVFTSIVASFWWGVATSSTVGYGDVYPITAPGKLVAGISIMLGVGLAALPAGILASGYVEFLSARREAPRCPYCGEALEVGAERA